MSLVFFDTSALLNLCLPEVGSQLATRLWDGASAVLASRITDAEGRGALAAGLRAGLLDHEQWRQALDNWATLWPALYKVELSPAVSGQAAQLIDHYPLRGGDAIQVASATGFGPAVIMASWDKPIRLAAAAQGLTVLPLQPIG